ncbi:hypothetical protein EN797_037725, partial [Mesorhizobium sp. M2E.F.Ca.ET.154.01.1.1]
LGELRGVLPRATWTAAGIGRHQGPVMEWALQRGADAVRTGLEDNIRVNKDASRKRRRFAPFYFHLDGRSCPGHSGNRPNVHQEYACLGSKIS